MGMAFARLIFALSTFVFVMAGICLVGLISIGSSDRPTRRLHKYAPEISSGKNLNLSEMDRVNQKPIIKKARDLFLYIGRILEIQRYSRDIELELTRADLPLRSHEFIGGLVMLSLVLASVGLLATKSLLMAVLFAMAGVYFPIALLTLRKGMRLKKFNGQICDALTTMSNSMRAGYSFLQAMELIGREMESPISAEFSKAITEMSLGASVETALHNMVRRVPSSDLDLVVTAVLIQRQVGGNMTEITDKICHTIRERMRIQGEIQTLTAQGRLSGTIIALLPFGLGGFMYLTNRSYLMPLFAEPLGKMLVMVALCGEGLGAWAISRIIKIEV